MDEQEKKDIVESLSPISEGLFAIADAINYLADSIIENNDKKGV